MARQILGEALQRARPAASVIFAPFDRLEDSLM
jgi:hypothetical protein